MKNPKSILITGASSGIGEALALDYAEAHVTLFISGRNQERLKAVKSACIERGALVYEKIIDVSDQDKMQQWIEECDAVTSLDLVIANAGISSSIPANQDLSRHVKDIFKINVDGVFHTVHPSLQVMKRRNQGQIAIVSSIAGYRGLPSSPAYSASKVAVKAYGEALRGLYHHQGIKINVICPGFVKSRLTAKNKFSMPFLMDAKKSAKIIRHGLAKNKGRITFPWQMKIIMGSMVRFLPEFLLEAVFRKMPKK